MYCASSTKNDPEPGFLFSGSAAADSSSPQALGQRRLEEGEFVAHCALLVIDVIAPDVDRDDASNPAACRVLVGPADGAKDLLANSPACSRRTTPSQAAAQVVWLA